MYLASVGVVQLLDFLTLRGQTAQLVREGGPIYPANCDGCADVARLRLEWLIDWRALLCWSLIAVGATLAVLISRRHAARIR
jgi:hypothetical protein